MDTNRMLTRDVDALPTEIREAILNGYNVMIQRAVKDGIVSAKITYYKYASGTKVPLCREEDLRKR